MDNEATEYIAPITDEGDEQQPEADNESSEETVDEVAKAKEVAENQKIRAEKAEKELKDLKAKAETETPKKEETEEKSNEPDYAKLAFLEGKGVKHPDDQKIVQDEANRLKLPLTDVLGMEHIKSKLKNVKDQRDAEAGMPDGKGKQGTGNKTSVDYWVNKTDKDGVFQTPKDLDLAAKVIKARLKQHTDNNKFADDMY